MSTLAQFQQQTTNFCVHVCGCTHSLGANYHTAEKNRFLFIFFNWSANSSNYRFQIGIARTDPMLDASSDVMRMDTTEHSVSSALHLGIKSERIFPSECHLNACSEPDYTLKSFSHLHPHHLPLHRNGLTPETGGYVSSPIYVTRTVPPGRSVTANLHYSSPIGYRHISNGVMSTEAESVRLTDQHSTPIHPSNRSNTVRGSSFETLAAATDKSRTTIQASGTDVSSGLNCTEQSTLVTKNDHPVALNISSEQNCNQQAQSTLNVEWLTNADRDNPKSCLTSCADFSWNQNSGAESLQTTKSTSNLSQLTIQTEHTISPESHKTQTTSSLPEPSFTLVNNDEELTEQSHRYSSPPTDRSDPGDRLSQTPTSGSDDELRAHLQSLQQNQSASHALCHPTVYHLHHPPLSSTQCHTALPNSHEDAASLEVSSETQRAMESSDSSPPSSGPGNRDSMDKVNPIDDLERRLTFSAHVSPSELVDWSTRLNHTSDNAQVKCIDNSARLNDAEGCVNLSVEVHDIDPTVQHPSMPFTDSDQLEKTHSISMTCDDPPSSPDDSDEGMSMARFEHMTNSIQPDRAGLFFCHLCDFTGGSRQEFQDHLRSHYDYKCLKCDYTSRTEGRLKRHMKDFHSEVPPDNFSGKLIRPMRPKLQRCKQCDFMTETKDEFWRHLRIHIKEDKRLECNLCCFVTEYKHHLEYHMRNHMGSKPYKCPKCNYECVNKSMLNSHMKSHSNVYPYRCANCHYATKYCHSLKLHLAKHDHKPAVVLNADGSLPPYDNTAELMSLRRGGGGVGAMGIRHGSTARFQAIGYKAGDTFDGAQQQQHKQSEQHPRSTPIQQQNLRNSTVNDLSQQQSLLNPMSTLIPFGQTTLVRPFTTGLPSMPGFDYIASNPLMTHNGLATPFPPMNTTSLSPLSGFIFPNPLFDSPQMFPGWLTQPGKPFSPCSTEPESSTGMSGPPNTPYTRTLPSQTPSGFMNHYDPLRNNSTGSEFALSATPNPSMMAAFLAAMHQSSLQSNAIATAQNTAPHTAIASTVATALSTDTNLTSASYSSSLSQKCQDLMCQTAQQVAKYYNPTQPGGSSCLSNTTDRKYEVKDSELQSTHDTAASAATTITPVTNCQSGTESVTFHPFLKRSYSGSTNAPKESSESGRTDTNNDAALDLSAKMTYRGFCSGEVDSVTNQLGDESHPFPLKFDQTTKGPSKLDGEVVRKRSCHMEDNESRSNSVPTDGTSEPLFDYECRFCEIRFRQRALYDIHMGFHSHTDPYLCNRCGHQSRNPVDFFIHLGQMAHHV